MKILAFHLSHDGTITYVVDNKIIFHTSLDRYNKFKHYYILSKPILNILEEIEWDVLSLTFLDVAEELLSLFLDMLRDNNKVFKKCIASKLNFIGEGHHHAFHAWNLLTMSKTPQRIFVCDGGGSVLSNGKVEQESVFDFNGTYLNHVVTTSQHIGRSYELRATNVLGTGQRSGELMALSSYGKFNENFYHSKDVSIQSYDKLWMKRKVEPEDTVILDLAFTTQQYASDNIHLFFDTYKKENISYTGGVSQNILINSELKNKYNNLIIDPINGDMGISLGVANKLTGNKIYRDNVFLGIPQSLDLESCPYSYNKTSISDVCKIVHNEPIAIFQSRSEQGQRGLGNRSLLMNPSHPNCRELLNKIKKREWFRPFAVSVLNEKAHEYFENVFESPYMLYVFKVNKKAKEHLTDGFAVDGTSRIQTVTEKTNYHYYQLIKEYDKLYNIPILLNTSLNRPGHVMVETLIDLYDMMKYTDLNYAYLPEIHTLIKK